MPHIFTLPDVGEGIAEAEVIQWLVSVGDTVDVDQGIAVIETDKAAVEMPSPVRGVVVALGAAEGERLQVGEPLITIDDGSADSSEGKDGVPTASSSEQTAFSPTPERAVAPEDEKTVGPRPRATPATRRLARELGIELTDMNGTGPGGRISDEDVQSAHAGAGQSAQSDDTSLSGVRSAAVWTSDSSASGEARVEERIAVHGLRRKTAESMVRAVQTIPHTVSFYDAEVDELLDLRRRLKPRADQLGIHLTLTPFLVKATALALAEYPMANSSFDSAANEIIVRAHRNIGVAASTPDGLVIPVIRDADIKPLLVIASEVERLSIQARARQVSLHDLQDGTFTITNHGPLGGGYGTPIIKPPESGILGFGRAAPQAVVRDGQIVARTILPISYSSDHRIVDGDLALGFCKALQALLQDPILLLADTGAI
jgi:pyruvate dehydrogenase E2 component (dihydrolipoamide acetyltransferase)